MLRTRPDTVRGASESRREAFHYTGRRGLRGKRRGGGGKANMHLLRLEEMVEPEKLTVHRNWCRALPETASRPAKLNGANNGEHTEGGQGRLRRTGGAGSFGTITHPHARQIMRQIALSNCWPLKVWARVAHSVRLRWLPGREGRKFGELKRVATAVAMVFVGFLVRHRHFSCRFPFPFWCGYRWRGVVNVYRTVCRSICNAIRKATLVFEQRLMQKRTGKE